MANVSHASLTGAELHEPKGVASASSGTVYVANGAGSGSWQAIGTSAFTGMIADFVAPAAPTGWLECDGSTISTTTYSALYGVMSITSSGTRTSGSAVITSVPSTTNFKVGYYVFGTGIASGTTILSVDSATQITLSGNASSSGTSTLVVSPWLLDTGTIKLPDLTTAGRYRRSRTSATAVGQVQADQNQSHTHSLSVTGTTDSQGAHTHTVNITDPGHGHPGSVGDIQGAAASNITSAAKPGGNDSVITHGQVLTIASNTTGITAATVSNGAHTHTVTSTGTSGSTGSSEARPLSMVFITCVKT